MSGIHRRRVVPSGGTAAQLVQHEIQAAPELISMDEVVRRHEGEWVLLRATEWDEDRWPTRGELLAHSPDHDHIWNMAASRPPNKARDEQHYIFQAHHYPRTGAELSEAIKRVWQRDDLDALDQQTLLR